MLTGLEKLAFSLVPAAADLAAEKTSDVIGAFAELLSASPEAQESDAAQSEQALVADIHASIEAHLKALGLPATSPFTVEVTPTGNFWIQGSSSDVSRIESELLDDDQLLQDIADYGSKHSLPGESYTLHWPPATYSETG